MTENLWSKVYFSFIHYWHPQILTYLAKIDSIIKTDSTKKELMAWGEKQINIFCDKVKLETWRQKRHNQIRDTEGVVATEQQQ